MLKTIIEWISQGIALMSIAVIVYGTLLSIVTFVRVVVKRDKSGTRRLRAEFGSYLLLGLEFMIAADIIKTIVEPTYQELIILAGIVILRTILSVFLTREIKDIEQSGNGGAPTAKK